MYNEVNFKFTYALDKDLSDLMYKAMNKTEDTCYTPVAIHKDRIKLSEDVTGEGMVIVGPKRTWVFEAWRVTSLESLNGFNKVILSDVKSEEYIILKPIFNTEAGIGVGDYAMYFNPDIKTIYAPAYYVIPMPSGYDTMVWFEAMRHIAVTRMTNVVYINRNMFRGYEEVIAKVIEESITCTNNVCTATQKIAVSTVSAIHSNGIIVIPGSNKEDSSLKPTMVANSYHEKRWVTEEDFFEVDPKLLGTRKYLAIISEKLIIVPSKDVAPLGWYKNTSEDVPGCKNVKSFDVSRLRNFEMSKTIDGTMDSETTYYPLASNARIEAVFIPIDNFWYK